MRKLSNLKSGNRLREVQAKEHLLAYHGRKRRRYGQNGHWVYWAIPAFLILLLIIGLSVFLAKRKSSDAPEVVDTSLPAPANPVADPLTVWLQPEGELAALNVVPVTPALTTSTLPKRLDSVSASIQRKNMDLVARIDADYGAGVDLDFRVLQHQEVANPFVSGENADLFLVQRGVIGDNRFSAVIITDAKGKEVFSYPSGLDLTLLNSTFENAQLLSLNSEETILVLTKNPEPLCSGILEIVSVGSEPRVLYRADSTEDADSGIVRDRFVFLEDADRDGHRDLLVNEVIHYSDRIREQLSVARFDPATKRFSQHAPMTQGDLAHSIRHYSRELARGESLPLAGFVQQGRILD